MRNTLCLAMLTTLLIGCTSVTPTAPVSDLPIISGEGIGGPNVSGQLIIPTVINR